MLRHNLLIIYRNIQRFKGSFFINLIGLSTGLACALLMYLWVKDELDFDRFHENDARLYQVMQNQKHESNIETLEYTPGVLADALLDEVTDIEYSSTVFQPSMAKVTLSDNDNHIGAIPVYVGKDFFKMFSFDLLEGNPDKVLDDKESVIISEALALKLFKRKKDIVGKMLSFQQAEQFMVSGVFRDVPANSTLQFDFVISIEYMKEKVPNLLSWDENSPSTYVTLKDNATATSVNGKIHDFIQRKTSDTFRTLFLRQYSDKHLYGRYDNGIQVGGRIEYVRLFSLIAVFVLLIACINFMNLSTARATRRIKEIAMKKVVGVRRESLIFQYLGESVAMAFLALFLAIVLVVLVLPKFNEITGKYIAWNFDLDFGLIVLGLTLVTGLISGSYPALYLSGFNPVNILKGKINNSMMELWARKGLVIFQFSISVILIVSVLIVYKQVEFIQTKDLGYNRDNIMYFASEGLTQEHMTPFMDELAKLPGVSHVSSIEDNIISETNSTGGVSWEGKDPKEVIYFEYRNVNFGMIELLGVKMAAGRPFSREFPSEELGVIFNEAAIKSMGLKDPIGKTVKCFGKEHRVIGIVENFNFASLHKNVTPFLFKLRPEYAKTIMVKVQNGTERETIDRVEEFYKEHNPGYAFDYKFLDEDYQAQYVAEKRVSILSGYFAGLAVIVSCLGLFGLAGFTAERRVKEIGIRKVLGSSSAGIAYLLSVDFTRIVIISIVIALPISYFLVTGWLDGFADRIDLHWWYFVGAGLLALAIAWLTIAVQMIKAARVNPLLYLKES